MIDEFGAGFWAELIFLALFSIVLIGVILYVFSKPLKTLLYIFKGRKLRAEIIYMPITDESGMLLTLTPIAAYEDESGLHTLTLRKEDFLDYGKSPLRDGGKATVFADENGEFTTLYHFFRTLIQAILLAAMPVLLLIGSAGMLYQEITDYHIMERIFSRM